MKPGSSHFDCLLLLSLFTFFSTFIFVCRGQYGGGVSYYNRPYNSQQTLRQSAYALRVGSYPGDLPHAGLSQVSTSGQNDAGVRPYHMTQQIHPTVVSGAPSVSSTARNWWDTATPRREENPDTERIVQRRRIMEQRRKEIQRRQREADKRRRQQRERMIQRRRQEQEQQQRKAQRQRQVQQQQQQGSLPTTRTQAFAQRYHQMERETGSRYRQFRALQPSAATFPFPTLPAAGPRQQVIDQQERAREMQRRQRQQQKRQIQIQRQASVRRERQLREHGNRARQQRQPQSLHNNSGQRRPSVTIRPRGRTTPNNRRRREYTSSRPQQTRQYRQYRQQQATTSYNNYNHQVPPQPIPYYSSNQRYPYSSTSSANNNEEDDSRLTSSSRRRQASFTSAHPRRRHPDRAVTSFNNQQQSSTDCQEGADRRAESCLRQVVPSVSRLLKHVDRLVTDRKFRRYLGQDRKCLLVSSSGEKNLMDWLDEANVHAQSLQDSLQNCPSSCPNGSGRSISTANTMRRVFQNLQLKSDKSFDTAALLDRIGDLRSINSTAAAQIGDFVRRMMDNKDRFPCYIMGYQ